MANKKEKSIEEIYQKKTPIEHVLIRPDTYIGSVQSESRQMYVWSNEKERIVKKEIVFVPGLYKILDEILVNAADNKTRDPTMKTIKVWVDRETNEISVYNDGQGIPIVLHAKENVYVPELIFGHLLTSSNYDDTEKKITGGRNGYGAKLCNIFSTRFVVETADKKKGKKFRQVYSKNMLKKEEPEITPYTGPEYTQVTFKPDLSKFGMTKLDNDFISLIEKRVYDMAGTVKDIDVYFNGQKIPIKGFQEYIRLYFNSEIEIITETKGRWEIAFVLGDEQFQHVSFVNRISTPRGGTHVNYIADQIVTAVVDNVKKKEKGLVIKPLQVKANIFLFLNCLIENPAFNSQTKETLTLKPSEFGSKHTLSAKFVNDVIKSGIVEKAATAARAKQAQELKKTDGHKTQKLRGIPKLDDANNAGTKKMASECTLILTEGDSAKSLAVSGLSVIGRDNFGVFPLRGKLLNVREATHKQLLENAEIKYIKKIMGFQHDKEYKGIEDLRYGHIMIMTDQDHDGSHIKGLIINMLERFYPSLLRIEGFLQQFITPIVRATKGERMHNFYTIPEFEAWTETEEGREKGWHIKYYKGLGTSTALDAKKYFSQLQHHRKEFTPLEQEDKEKVELAFSKKHADARKVWLKNFLPGTVLDNRAPKLSIGEFIDKELIHFSVADNVRSIPSVIDGLKPGQRKIIYSCFKRKLDSEIKVAQLAGYVAEHSAYHHGEQSLCATIVNLAQSFVGSNNIALLQPIGQFGTRLQGGKDAASARYIYTALDKITRYLFKEEDDPLLTYLKDDNMLVEPDMYVPVIPVLLVNGAEGIGTGWSTSIPSYNPREITENILRMIRGEEPQEMTPFYKGFTGTTEEIEPGKYRTVGTYEIESKEILSITELPIGCWTQNYKDFLETLINSGEIKDYREYNTDTKVFFEIKMDKVPSSGIEKKFKLTTQISTANMVAFNHQGTLQKYSSPLEILAEFYQVRKDLYTRRKDYLLQKIYKDLLILQNKVKFIKEVISDTLVIVKRKSTEIYSELESKGYQKKEESYEYLLTMPISSLTVEREERLSNEAEQKKAQYDTLKSQSIEALWIKDLQDFLDNLDDSTGTETTILPSKKRRVPKAKESTSAPKKTIQKPKPATKKQPQTPTPPQAPQNKPWARFVNSPDSDSD
ncbi:DNA topoisomerase II [Nematocida sp. AWRm80]|nr:DNA topoisomerase II [Nematocida sp. AWRm80]